MATYRHALITGGSAGIGLAIARAVASRCTVLTLIARDPDKLSAAALDLTQGTGCTVEVIAADVADEAALTAGLTKAVAHHGPIDFAVTSAGQVHVGMLEDLPMDAFTDDMAVNYFGTVNVVMWLIREKALTAGARLCLISSGAGIVGIPGYGAYAPSKFAVRGFAEVLRTECTPQGIHISVAYPPDTDTQQYRDECVTRPAVTHVIADTGSVFTAERVADDIVRGIEAGRFVISTGIALRLLIALHSVIHPLWRVWSDIMMRRAM